MTRRIRIKGVKRRELSTEDISYLYYLRAKQVLRDRRQAEARRKAKRPEQKS